MTPRSAFKFRLYPNRKQEDRMVNAIEVCRRLWNMALEDRKWRWENERSSTTYWQQCLMLTAEVQVNPSMKTLYGQSLQDVLRRLDKAFKAFFRGDAGRPKFKKYRDWGSFTYPQTYNGSVKLDPRKKRLFLSKVGNLKVVAHRPVPSGAKLKTCTVERAPDGKWFACLVYDEVVKLQGVRIPASWKSPVGVDLGLKSLITTSDGEKVKPPKFFRKAERRLERLHRGLSKKKDGSRNSLKARRRLAVQYSKVANQRRDFNHKLSARLVTNHDLVAFEDLGIKRMVRNHTLAKSIEDAAWGQLVEFSEYKSRRAGSVTVKVQAHYSTQECYFCGTLNPIPLDVREFACRGCGRVLDRDKNAGRIVLKRGILQVGQDKGSGSPRPVEENPDQVVPELKPVEIGPLPPQSTGEASPVIEAGTTRGWNERPAAGSPRPSDEGGCHKAGALPDFLRRERCRIPRLSPEVVLRPSSGG